ncbi:CBS domain-containing protein [Methanosphaerula subterraneus]|uniref:CBS domain-containing protein n=1 Tax=Methanosphaerula subterraneus TaxID=3350244 RepID=UPI003F868ACF
MDLSLIQKDILITLITLYHQHSHPIKGEEIAEVIKRNPGTIRNQMQALKALELVDGVPGPKGGYNPTARAYKELSISAADGEAKVRITRQGAELPGVSATEIDFTTLCHPDVCHAVVKVIGSVKGFEIGDQVAIGPTPVNKLFVRGEVFGKDEVDQGLIISISEMISLPKLPIRSYMSTPLLTLSTSATIAEAVHLFNTRSIHGAPVMNDGAMKGIVTISDLIRAIDEGKPTSEPVSTVMTPDVIEADGGVRLFEVVKRFKEREIGRLIVVENGHPVGILTQSDVLRVFPTD